MPVAREESVHNVTPLPLLAPRFTPSLLPLHHPQVMGKGRKRKLRPEEAGGQAGVFKWKAERKR